MKTSCYCWRERCESPTSPKFRRHRSRVRTTCRSSKDRSPPQPTPHASTTCGPLHGHLSPSAHVRPPAGFRGYGTSRRQVTTLLRSTPIPSTSLPSIVDAHFGARRRRLRVARLPDRPASTARGDHCLCVGPSAGGSHLQRVPAMQGEPNRLRPGRCRYPVPRSGDESGLRGSVPGPRSGLFRVFRPDRGRQYIVSGGQASGREACNRSTRLVSFELSTPAHRPSAMNPSAQEQDLTPPSRTSGTRADGQQ